MAGAIKNEHMDETGTQMLYGQEDNYIISITAEEKNCKAHEKFPVWGAHGRAFSQLLEIQQVTETQYMSMLIGYDPSRAPN